MNYWADFYRSQKQPQGPLPPQTIAQQVFDLSQSLAARLRAVYSAWSYLGALEFYELLIGELPGRLDALSRALTPRYVQKTVVTKTGEWFLRLEVAQSKLVSISTVAPFFGELHPDARRLEGLAKKLRESNKVWRVDLKVLMTNAATRLHDFVFLIADEGYSSLFITVSGLN